MIDALDRAVDISLSNVPNLPGKTLVAVDGSGSMSGRPIEIASFFAAVLARSNDVDMIIFSNDAEYFTANRKYDRIVILSDMQAWVGYTTPKTTFENYKKRTGADPVVYSFDLAGHGTLQFPENKVYCFAGFSEKVFDIMALLETDREALVREIENVTI